MWQVLFAAAVAGGSGFIANRFLSSPNTDPNNINPETDSTNLDHLKQTNNFSISSPESQSFDPTTLVCDGDGSMSMFRFSSSSGSPSKSGSWRKSGKNGCGGSSSRSSIRGNGDEGFESGEFGKVGVFQQNKSKRKFGVCVKKRRITKNAPGKCESCSSSSSSSSQGNPLFSWGLGVGIMYMMSSGKAEISRLNTAMDETAKVVQELKTELSKRKSSRSLQVSSSKTDISTNADKPRHKNTQSVPQSSTDNRDNVQASGLVVTDEGDCASSVLTDEPLQEMMEMDRLEAELESELQKLPWCSTEGSGLEGRISDICENDASAEGFCRPDDQNSNSYQFNGVLPSELDQKLSNLLVKQQESQIVELESELHQAQSKLHEKEAELQALKDCVKRLTEFSLTNASDEETEALLEQEKTDDNGNKMGPESRRSVVGMKRAMEFESYSCHIK